MDGDSALLTDLYQLTMLQGYFEQRMDEVAVFEFFVRKLPPQRGFLMAAGLEQLLDYLENFKFEPADIDYLSTTGRFSTDFIDYLATLRFSGDVEAMAEGTPFFADEPIVRVIAPIAQAQLVESRLINLLQFQTLIASKAARCVLAAPGKLLVDFGMRRAHGSEAALMAARASYLAGFSGSSTVLAGQRFDIPIFGTMAHSFVQAHDYEEAAFEHFAQAQPNNVVLLIDTYDTETAARKVVELVPRLQQQGIVVKSVRIDSGDLADHACSVRAIFDAAGMEQITIFSSGSLDELQLRQFQRNNIPIDGFGVGTLLDTSADAPYLDCAYKLQEYAGVARRKRSEGKATWPGRKQVWRCYDDAGVMVGDMVALVDESQAGEPLLQPVMVQGRRLKPAPSLQELRQHALGELQRLPESLRQLEPYSYAVEISGPLQALAQEVDLQPH